MTNKIFALIGPNGSGKTLLASMLIQNKVHYIPYYTTPVPFGKTILPELFAIT